MRTIYSVRYKGIPFDLEPPVRVPSDDVDPATLSLGSLIAHVTQPEATAAASTEAASKHDAHIDHIMEKRGALVGTLVVNGYVAEQLRSAIPDQAVHAYFGGYPD